MKQPFFTQKNAALNEKTINKTNKNKPPTGQFARAVRWIGQSGAKKHGQNLAKAFDFSLKQISTSLKHLVEICFFILDEGL